MERSSIKSNAVQTTYYKSEMKIRDIFVCGFRVEVYDFGYASYYYPSFNGNAEFKVSSKGFRELSHYLRFITYAKTLLDYA